MAIRRLHAASFCCTAILAVIGALHSSCSSQAGSGTSQVVRVEPVVVRELPHDTLAFTQGLYFDKGLLFESTGAPDKRVSSLRVIDAKDGRVLRTIPVPGVFAEGIAVHGNRLVQLTWQDQKAFVYSFPDLAPLGSVAYEGQGWGLTWNGSLYVMSDGSDTLFYRDMDFRVKRSVAVKVNHQPLKNLNELEYVRGRIYANVWYSSYIFEIDPNGTARRIIDCNNLLARVRPSSENDVLNGIAFDDSAGTFYLTGKNWRAIYEVKIP
jgi:glutaminyl-peptide cyclotransferase